jgi:hypothetical protein
MWMMTPLADNTNSAERPDIVEGDATGKKDQGQANIFRHVREQRDDEKKATDKSGEDEGKMILVRKKIRKMGRKMIRMMHKHLEDAEKEESRGDDTKSVQEVETENEGEES